MVDSNMEQVIEWQPLTLADGTIIEVMNSPVRDNMGIAYSCTPVEAQQKADELGAYLLTPKLMDLYYASADIKLTAHTQSVGWNSHICPNCKNPDKGPWLLCWKCGSQKRSAAEVVEMNNKIAVLNSTLSVPRDDYKISGFGKPWVIAKSCFIIKGRIGQPYSWYSPAAPALSVTGKFKLWQGYSGQAPHDSTQLDYAEPMVFWRSPIAAELLTGPKSYLISHEGPLSDIRLPGVQKI